MSEQCQCPASMCPLIARDGSPCPENDDIDNGGCPWFSMACGTGGIHAQVMEAYEAGGKHSVLGPNQPKREDIGQPREFDCPKVSVCSWQKHSGEKLCPPRLALSLGLDPRVCLF